MKIEEDLRHPKGEKINEATPKRLEDIFGKVGVINATVLVPRERSYTMRPNIPHAGQKNPLNHLQVKKLQSVEAFGKIKQ